jgi:alkylation response protein AidB-like acyl-CoA dehydrogenase
MTLSYWGNVGAQPMHDTALRGIFGLEEPREGTQLGAHDTSLLVRCGDGEQRYLLQGTTVQAGMLGAR